MMACIEPEGLMELESAFMQALGEVETFQVGSAELTLEDESGNVLLRFEREGLV
jgi:heat shock protein HslJ